MSSDETPNRPSREELEEQVIALLMGELDGVAAEKIEAAIEGDPRLKEFHRRMQNTLGFVEEAVSGPEISKAPTPLRLSEERRDELFAKVVLAKQAKQQPDNIVESRWQTRRRWITGLSIAAGLMVLWALVSPRLVMYDRLDPASPFEGIMAMEAPGAKTGVEHEAEEAEPMDVRLLGPAEAVGFVDVDKLAESASSSAPMQNVRREAEKSTPAPVALSIVLPDQAPERDEQDARGQFFASVPKYVADLSGPASDDRSQRLDRVVKKLPPTDAAAPAKNYRLQGRDFSAVELSDEIRKAPNFAGASYFGREPGAVGGFVPPGESPVGTAPQSLAESQPAFAYVGSRVSSSDEAKGDVSSRLGVVRESAREKALFFDTEAQVGQAPVNAPAIVPASPAPESFEVAIGGGMGGGGAGISLGGAIVENRRMYERPATASTLRRKAKLSEVAADDDTVTATTARGRARSGVVDGFELNQSSSRPSPSRSESEIGEKQVTRELAQNKEFVVNDALAAEDVSRLGVSDATEVAKRIAGDGALAKKRAQVDDLRRRPVALMEAKPEALLEQLVDLQSPSAPKALLPGYPIAAPAPVPPAENKQRLLVESKRIGGRASSAPARGLQGLAKQEAATRPAPANFDSGMEKPQRARKSAAEDAEVAKSERLSKLVRDGLANQERVIGVSESWNRQPAKNLPEPSAYYSVPAPANPASLGWAFEAGNSGKDADRYGNGPAKVEDLFVTPSVPTAPFGYVVVAGEEGPVQMDFDDGAVKVGGDFTSLYRPHFSAYVLPPGERDTARPADKSNSNQEVLRRLNRDLAGQASSPVSTEEFLKQSRELSRSSQDNKKALGDASLRSDLGRAEADATNSVGDPNWIGLLENPASVRGPSNLFIGRYPGTFVLSQLSNQLNVTRTNGFVGKIAVEYSTPRKTPPTTLAAIIPPTVTSLAEEDEAKPQPKVRPQKPKTLEPKPENLTKDNAFSTFSLNVSDVAFKLAAASLKAGKLPDPETVRSEEFLNALDYHDPAPRGNERLAFAWDRARNPFAHNRDFLRFSIQTAALGRESGQPLNLVVLLDASGSMERADRLAIVRQMLSVLAGQLKPTDRISVVAFARTPWLLVDGMKGGRPKELLDRVTNITPQGGTNIEIGLDLAYLIAHRHYLAQGNNRVIVLTDGAANLGNVDPEALKAKVEEQRKKNVALDCFGVGWEGYNDDLLETLSRNGDGRYGFINDPAEARDGFADLLAGALQVAAANVKAQIEFNTNRVIAYRQIGYTKHQLKKEQFRDNTVDAAEIGAAESGTAMYSIQVDRNGRGPLATVRVRYKIPATGRYVEEEWELPYDPGAQPLESAKPSMRLATVAASFAEWMAANPHAASVSLRDLERHLTGVPEEFSSDERPKQLRTMLQQARRISGE